MTDGLRQLGVPAARRTLIASRVLQDDNGADDPEPLRVLERLRAEPIGD